MNIYAMIKFGEIGRVVKVLDNYEKNDILEVFKMPEMEKEKDVVEFLKERLDSYRGKDALSEILTALFVVLKMNQLQKYEDSFSLTEEYVEKTKNEGFLFYQGIFTRERAVVMREFKKPPVDVIRVLMESVSVFEKAEEEIEKEEMYKIDLIQIEKAVSQFHLVVTYLSEKNFEKSYEVSKKCLDTFLSIEVNHSRCLYVNQVAVLFSSACLKLQKDLIQRKMLLRIFKVLDSHKDYDVIFKRQKIELMMRIADTFEEESHFRTVLRIKKNALKICPPECLQERSLLVHSICNILLGEYRYKEFLEVYEKLPVVKDSEVMEVLRAEMKKRADFVRKHVEDGKEAQLKLHMKNMSRKVEKKKKKKKEIDMVCVCGKKEGKMNRCARCKLEFYCSRECQVKDWKNHKQFCVDLFVE